MLIIRDASVEDFGWMIEMGARMHAESAYASYDYCPDKLMKMALALKNSGKGKFLIAEKCDEKVGMMIGYLDRFYFGDDILASDLLLYVEKDRRGSVIAKLLIEEFCKWAFKNGAVEVKLGTTTGIDTSRVGSFYEKLGFAHIGGIYKRSA